jgi:hypothetical protein
MIQKKSYFEALNCNSGIPHRNNFMDLYKTNLILLSLLFLVLVYQLDHMAIYLEYKILKSFKREVRIDL